MRPQPTAPGRAIVTSSLCLALTLAAVLPSAAQTYNIRDIATVAGNVRPLQINDAGQAIGQVDTNIGSFGFFHNGLSTIPLSLGGTYSQALDMNGIGHVVGYAYLPGNAVQRAFVFKDGVVTDLNTLISPNSGWTLTAARAINDSGQIVGQGILNNQQRAFLYTPTPNGATVVDLGHWAERIPRYWTSTPAVKWLVIPIWPTTMWTTPSCMPAAL